VFTSCLHILLNCSASDLHCLPPAKREDEAMQTLDHLIDFFCSRGEIYTADLFNMCYEVPLIDPPEATSRVS
jgi:hypothetical protein